MGFIKVTAVSPSGATSYIRIADIVGVAAGTSSPNTGKAVVQVRSGGDRPYPWQVMETPDEVMALIAAGS
ncbi:MULTISPECIES: hypothetical protein [Aminobacter]|jgi:hypothetical protein|uniref:Uncharacterized protein n=1 Tax=Aminobacter ciceronei TaxID=150723 RepID=A0ABR6CH14_9HYPH|nr:MULTISPECIES: hypothetical protein [Aminobacter]WMC99556.1 hypothetical protein RAR13_13005 [Aminobacter aminovorans]MBA8910077.1 hypothetical protein [Aminobacter ciceronei]MBA9023850.1 hypothetical protein [Aminobacter ciceronei]MRX36827.1 hypothetical protein [Aminobacter sp. MDW-2]QNH32734.1 hypothetical protein H5P29_19620 [Aminobacter sp. MDW-2]